MRNGPNLTRVAAAVVAAALIAVGAIRTSRADDEVAALVTRLEEGKTGKERADAADALAKLGSKAEAAVPALVVALGDDDLDAATPPGAKRAPGTVTFGGGADDAVARSAAWALARIGEPSIGPLIVALGADEAGVRGQAAFALARIGEGAADLDPAAARVLRGKLSPAVPTLLGILENDAPREGALNEGGDDPPSSPKPPAGGGTLAFDGPTVTHAADEAADALGTIAIGVVGPATKLLDHDDRGVRRRAASVLARVPAPAAAASLKRLLEALADHPGPKVKQRPALTGERRAPKTVGSFAAAALARIGAPAIPGLIERAGDEDAATRQNAVTALGGMGKLAGRAIPIVESLLEDPDEQVRLAASDAIRAIERGR